MRTVALFLGIFTTLLATWPWALMPATACAPLAAEVSCSAGSCCAGTETTSAPRTPCDPEERPCCDPFMACSGCNCPMPTAPLAVVAVSPVLLQCFAPHPIALLNPVLDEAWHPPNTDAHWA